MAKDLLIILCSLLYLGQAQASGIFSSLIGQIENLHDGDRLLVEYSFEGCFGPYHHGSIEMILKGDSIHFLERSFDHNDREGISQSGKYERTDLIKLLEKKGEQRSSEIYGNVLNYRFILDGQLLEKGADRIEQRHFISLFQPLTSIFTDPDFPLKNKPKEFVH